MDNKFSGVAFGGGWADAGTATRGTGGAVWPERGGGVEGGDRACSGRGPTLFPLRNRGGGFMAQGTRSSALPLLEGLRQDLQRADRHAAVGPAPQGALVVVRSRARGRRDGLGVGGAVRCGGAHGRPRSGTRRGRPVGLRRRRHPISGQLSELVPPRRPRLRRQ